jgi:hypothetical protein
MATSARQRDQFIDRFMPGFRRRLKEIGAGRLTFDEEPEFDRLPDSDYISSLWVSFTYTFNEGGSVEVTCGWRLAPGKQIKVPRDSGKPINPEDWVRDTYAFHCNGRDGKGAFRIDLDAKSRYHAHMPPKMHEHIDAGVVTPNTRNIDPLVFLELVQKCLSDRVCPLSRTP